LFWLEEFDAEKICDEIKVVVSMSHLRKSVSHRTTCHAITCSSL
jgi:hypothetical protein